MQDFVLLSLDKVQGMGRCILWLQYVLEMHKTIVMHILTIWPKSSHLIYPEKITIPCDEKWFKYLAKTEIRGRRLGLCAGKYSKSTSSDNESSYEQLKPVLKKRVYFVWVFLVSTSVKLFSAQYLRTIWLIECTFSCQWPGLIMGVSTQDTFIMF